MALSLHKSVARYYFLALCLLLTGVIFGGIGSLEYIFPGLLRNTLSFEKIRPLHVSSVVFWILTGAIGTVVVYQNEHSKKENSSNGLLKAQWIIFTISIIAIIISYFLGIFGGREYWEFHPVFALPITISWILLIIYFIKSTTSFKKQPVYIWMWLTGAFFFLFTYLESNMWLIPSVRNQLIYDMTIQWKSYGSLVGAWNMLIYGSSIYLMDKILGHQKYSYSALAFWLYFLGLLNGMFNWGHHIYTLPTHNIIHYIAYGVSMTELILLARIIYLWKSSIQTAKKHIHIQSYQFIFAADIWIFITLAIAILMSIPALNLYIHGTQVVVGHTMGATIGINTFLLFAFIFDFINKNQEKESTTKFYKFGFLILQICLPIFFLSLIIAGILKGFWQMETTAKPFSEMMQELRPWFLIFAVAGFGLIIGFFMIGIPLLKNLYKMAFGHHIQ